MVQLLRQRSADRSFDRLYRAHAGDVYRYSLGLTGNPADAEDVAQTTFMNAYRALERGEHPAQARAWLIAIAHNVCRQRFRQASRRPAEVAFDEEVAEALVPDESIPTATDIQRALGHLPTAQREALVMRELEGRSYAEIGETLGLTVSAVESTLFRARRALREQIETSLSCDDAEAAISLQMDGRLARADRGSLRGHLRACAACRTFARRQRAQRHGWKAFAALPLPPSLGSMLGAGPAAGIGAGVVLKVAAVTTAVVVAGSGAYAVVQHGSKPAPSRPIPRARFSGTGGVRRQHAAQPPPAKTAGLVRREAERAGHAAHARAKPTTAATARLGAARAGNTAAATHARSPVHAAHSARPSHPQRRVHPTKRPTPKHRGEAKAAPKDSTADSSAAAPPSTHGHGKDVHLSGP